MFYSNTKTKKQKNCRMKQPYFIRQNFLSVQLSYIIKQFTIESMLGKR